ncbi:probable cytochrome P450 6a14 [Aphidius gifuensis]|uniref:probable cytochrome P450 6a14 n=1 Tax=Aphidius gifuensis TaxID=684658 RepID=UPI001CDD203F|nr:probable cytochrome P450 6a14 [Aphidius gifuensis]
MEFQIQTYIVALILIILTIFYLITKKLNYWENLGVPGPKPVPVFGNFTKLFLKKLTAGQVIQNIYTKWKHESFVGVYKGHSPQLIINDLDLIKTILIKDFDTFNGRGILINEDTDPLSANIVNIDGPRWKFIRAKLTPLFTTGKLKQMIELMVECADHFEIYLSNQLKKSNVIDCREVAAKFTTDVIGSCAFGINMNALSNDESEFRKIGRKVFESNFYAIMKSLLGEISPQLFTLLKISINDSKSKNDNEIEFTDSLMTAQAFVFFLGGFETSSTLISMSLYELAVEPKVQEKLRNEIIETLKNSDGQLTYDVINSMKYLDMVMQETVRKDPPILTLIRRACRSYKIPETNTTIEKGTNVNIPVYAIHHDPSYYPSPEKFDPERFTDSAKAQRHPMTFLAFGDGPKNCIGLRFAGYQYKLGIIKILKNYRVKPSKSTVVPYEMDKGSFILTPKNVHKSFSIDPFDTTSNNNNNSDNYGLDNNKDWKNCLPNNTTPKMNDAAENNNQININRND